MCYPKPMTITKYGQCCLLIEVAGKRILTDPGVYSRGYGNLTNLDLILITHEHQDHCHIEALTALVAQNPCATVVTNSAVGILLKRVGISFRILEGRESATLADLVIEAFDGPHAEIFGSFGLVQNTGYFISEALFYPGDAYIEPLKPVPVLALPVGGPWCKASDAIRYALSVKPTRAFPVHDALLNPDGVTLTHRIFAVLLQEHHISFTPLQAGESATFD